MKDSIREQILNGNLELPGYDLFITNGYTNVLHVVCNMWHSMWHNYCTNLSGTSTIYWLEQAGAEHTKEFLGALNVLRDNEWIVLDTRDNFSSATINVDKLLRYVDDEELGSVRFDNRFIKYLPTASTRSPLMSIVKSKGKHNGNVLNRQGMEIGAKSLFTFDKSTLTKHLDAVKKESNKGMLKVLAQYPELKEDKANYGNVLESIIDYLSEEDVMSNMGTNYCDTRGRAIKSNLDKVGNPIGFKAFRALLVLPKYARKVATIDGRDSILLFVAELNGYKKGTVDGKLEFGMHCWLNNTLPHDLHETIWCERLYKELYGFEISQIEGTEYKWSTPIELDASASVLQYIGVLLNDEDLLKATNVISDGELNDPWSMIDNVDRNKGKKVLMRQIYGSSRNASQILDSFQEDYTSEEILNLEKGLNSGAYGKANKLKEFIISSAVMEPDMNPVVWGEVLKVPCNRHHVVGEKPVVYSMVDSKGNIKKVVHWLTSKIPDLKSFKRWSVTGLIHALDSQVIDLVMNSIKWGIDIHDAVICGPEDALTVRKSYAKSINSIYKDRVSILNTYLKSIGVRNTKEAAKEWDELVEMVKPVKNFECSMWAMK